ncbi:MAG TPA: TetR/AcrR family transcriptional regulator [Acidimicrobiales bacterium]|nr:TetR/AcrR family transcriptional regulator [Acidimicrobiales bacterium]
MTRLARDRDTHLTEGEIAAEALRCFDQTMTAPSIRQLATVLKVTPSAIYHHYPSRAAIVQAAVNLVWEEATAQLLELIPDPFTADPIEVLVSSALATRRAFGSHHRIAPFMAATPKSDQPLVAIVALMATIFERLGLDADTAAASFHSYASFTIGSTLFAATRRITTETAEAEIAAGPGAGDGGGSDAGAGAGAPAGAGASAPAGPGAGAPRTDGSPTSTVIDSDGATSNGILRALDEMMDLSVTDPARDEDLFVEGLRRLIAGFAPPDPS